MICRETDELGVLRLAERSRAEIGKAAIAIPNGVLRFTASGGRNQIWVADAGTGHRFEERARLASVA